MTEQECDQGMLRKHKTLGSDVSYLTRLIAASIRVRNGETGLLPGQMPVALALWDQPNLTQKQLCERVQIEQGTMAATLKRMERDGFISRVANAQDQRQAFVTLTPKGQAAIEDATANAREVNQLAAIGLGPEELAIIRRAIAVMTENLETDLGQRRQLAAARKEAGIAA